MPTASYTRCIEAIMLSMVMLGFVSIFTCSLIHSSPRLKLLSAVFSSHPPNLVPLDAIIGAFSVLPDNLRIPMPHGLVIRISVRPSPSKSAISSKELSAVFSSHPPNLVPLGAIIGAFSVVPDNLRIPIPHGLVTRISARPSPSKSATGLKRLSAVFSSHPPNLVPLGAIIGALSVFPDNLRIPIPHGLVTRISALPSPSKSATGPKRLSAVFSSHPPNLVPLGAIIGALSVVPDNLRIPMPHGLVTRISARPSPSKSAVGPKRLSAVFSSHPPNLVPLGAIIGALSVVPDNLRIPMPHGLVTRISALPSPSKSATGPKRLSAVFSSHPPNLVPLGAIIGAFRVLPDNLRMPMPHGLVTRISARPSPSKSAVGPKLLSAVFSNHPPNLVPLGAIIGAFRVLPASLRIPMPHGLVTRISALPSPSKSATGPKRLSAVFSSNPPNLVPLGA